VKVYCDFTTDSLLTASSDAMIAGGFGMFWRRILALRNHGSQTKSSWLMNFFVGTWKTSVICVRT
jgi:hypothetical protein